MAKMRAVQVPHPNGPLELVERDIPEPSAGSVRIKVQACGVCHSDALTKDGTWPGLDYPRVPGHEVAGVIDAWVPGSWAGKPAKGSESAGSGETAVTVILAAGVTSACAKMPLW